jgi:hypothetical protein
MIADTTDTLTVRDFFKNDQGLNRVEQIQFMDGAVWGESEIIGRAYAPTEGDDTIYGGIGDDNLNALGGNDQLYGRGGNDTLNGGTASHRRDHRERREHFLFLLSAISAPSAINSHALAA